MIVRKKLDNTNKRIVALLTKENVPNDIIAKVCDMLILVGKYIPEGLEMKRLTKRNDV